MDVFRIFDELYRKEGRKDGKENIERKRGRTEREK